MTRVARNTIEERGEDGKLNFLDCNVMIEKHKQTRKRIQNRLKQKEIMQKNLKEYWLHESEIKQKECDNDRRNAHTNGKK